MRKLNCWDFHKCGRGPDAGNREGFEPCPAATEERLHGVNGGENAGRCCWAIAGTMCDGEPQGTFSKKYKHCGRCAFYQKVKEDEREAFVPTIILFKRLER